MQKSNPESQADSHKLFLSMVDERQQADKFQTQLQAIEERLAAMGPTGCTVTKSSGSTKAKPNTVDKRITHVTANGAKWDQMIFYCSSHGVNPSHSNEQCTNKKGCHVPGATLQDRKGGSTENLEKLHWWCKRKTNKDPVRVYHPVKPE